MPKTRLRPTNPSDVLHPFVRAVAEFAMARALFLSDAKIAVALSGGADSSALLWALCEASDAGLVPRPIAALHFHHGIRGADADEDVAFCQHLAHGCGVAFRAGHATPGGQINEAAARRARYAFLVDAARACGATTIATAHHADDQAETILLRLLRGASVDGLAGIPLRRRFAPDIELVRPLLGQRRAAIETYCFDRGIAFRHDPTNDDLRYPRNRLRLLMPLLEAQFNPRLVEAIGRLGALASDDAQWLDAQAASLEQRARREPCELDREALRAAPAPLRRRVLLRALRRVAHPGSVEAIQTREWVAVAESLLERPGRVDLPGGACLESTQEGLWALEPAPRWSGPVPVDMGGRTCFPGGGIEALGPEDGETDGRWTVALPLDWMTGACVRSAAPGERMEVPGRVGARRLRDLCAQARWPVTLRERAVVVARGESGGILWLIGVGATACPDTGARVRLRAHLDWRHRGEGDWL